MSVPSAKLTAVTLGVRDLPVSARFYQALGFEWKFRATGDEIVFLDGGGVVLALWDLNKLAEDFRPSFAAPTARLSRGDLRLELRNFG